MDKGIFITVEGMDGAGKTTQVNFLKRWMVEREIDVLSTREPGGTRLGESLREILLDSENSGLSDHAELLLMFAARKQHLDEVILPAIQDGRWVLCDRFTDATYAYQGGGRGISMSRIQQLENWVQRGFEPNLTIILDVPVAVGLERIKKRGGEGDRIEQQEIAFKEAVRTVYLQRAKDFPKRIKLIDATNSLEVVQKELIQCLMDNYQIGISN